MRRQSRPRDETQWNVALIPLTTTGGKAESVIFALPHFTPFIPTRFDLT